MSPHRSSGFSLVSALFLMVVLSALGAYMVSMSTAQHRTAASSALGAHAYYAARSGVEWGAGRAIGGSCAAATLNFAAYPGVTVAITCAATNHTEAASYNVYRIQATATSSGAVLGDPNYVSRTVVLTITDYLPP